VKDDEADPRSLIEANARPWDSYWYWRDKPIAERGAAGEILRSARVQVGNLISRPPNEDPPDCEGTLDGEKSAIEVTELVHRPALERSIKAANQRAVGLEPNCPEVYFEWDRETLIAAIQERIEIKDAAKLRGGPYERYVLVIHTDEFFPHRNAVSQFLEGAKFRAQRITDVFLGLSPEPGCGVPTFRLDLGE
jgi:hypothetical protein